MKARRKELGISAEMIAEKIGISPATIYRYENGGIDKVPGDRLKPIARALQTTPAYLMGWDEEPNNQKEKPIPEDELGEDAVVVHRNGERIVYHITKEKLQAIQPLLESLDTKTDPDL